MASIVGMMQEIEGNHDESTNVEDLFKYLNFNFNNQMLKLNGFEPVWIGVLRSK